MTNLSRFEFNGNSVEAFVDEMGRDWFRGTQVCKVLEIGDAYSAINRYAQDYSREWKVGEGRPSLYVSEPGLYALIFASKSLAAKKFQRWVFEEVLPKLRASGGYIMPTATSDQLLALQAEIKTQQRTIAQLDRKYAALENGTKAIEDFFAECCTFQGAATHTFMAELHGVYRFWCGRQGKKPLAVDDFADLIKRRFGVEYDRGSATCAIEIRSKYKQIGYESKPVGRFC